MQLTAGERLALLTTLPREGNFATLKIVRTLRESLSFSEEEHKALGIHQEGNTILWDAEADQPREIALGEKATDIVVETLKRLDQEEKLTEQLVSVYEKFVA